MSDITTASSTQRRSLIVRFYYKQSHIQGQTSPSKRRKVCNAKSIINESEFSTTASSLSDDQNFNGQIMTPPSTQQSNFKSQYMDQDKQTVELIPLITNLENELYSQERDKFQTFTERYANSKKSSPMTETIINIKQYHQITPENETNWYEQCNTVVSKLRAWKTLYKDLESRKRVIKRGLLLKSDDDDDDDADDEEGKIKEQSVSSNNTDDLGLEEENLLDVAGRGGRRRRPLRS